ncbi:HAD-IIB family hydrolase [Culicoidibacter larvae]|uniref:HAD family phosphatase n=1 Tax=Culicoidibacter larvae TaxID=2579976 RepID=A0A5R8QFX6_9FIRM|nr:HAD family hydrolase [Culicoidibacter larvae]TLG76660.1 HAD family phosphatase [Culicoidibacter larvae]
MIKLFISDLDGTLLHGEQFTSVEVGNMELGEAIKANVGKLAEHGIDFAIATGRYVNDIAVIEQELGLQNKHYRVALNGAFIYYGDEKLISKAVDTKTALAFIETIKSQYSRQSHFFNVYFEYNEKYLYPFKWYTRLFSGVFLKRMHAQKWHAGIIDNIRSEKRPVYKFLIGIHENALVKVQSELEELYPQLSIFASSPRSIEVCAPGVDKGEAIKEIMKRMNLTPDEVAFVGDSGNDVSGFKVVTHSFIMSHAHKRYKKDAKYEVHSVSEAIEQVLAINKSGEVLSY